jgi:hypothetical protein
MGIITRQIETLKLHVSIVSTDIEIGIPCDPTRCMHRVGITRAATQQLNLTEEEARKLHVTVKNSGITFNYQGHRWRSPTPQKAINSLIQYDNEKTRQLVRPHNYAITAIKGEKVVPFTRERQDQINAARIARAEAGCPDRVYKKPTLRDRIVGNTLDLRADNGGRNKKAA